MGGGRLALALLGLLDLGHERLRDPLDLEWRRPSIGGAQRGRQLTDVIGVERAEQGERRDAVRLEDVRVSTEAVADSVEPLGD
eukprot:6584296-Prymnesium_polylepis.1